MRLRTPARGVAATARMIPAFGDGKCTSHNSSCPSLTCFKMSAITVAYASARLSAMNENNRTRMAHMSGIDFSWVDHAHHSFFARLDLSCMKPQQKLSPLSLARAGRVRRAEKRGGPDGFCFTRARDFGDNAPEDNSDRFHFVRDNGDDHAACPFGMMPEIMSRTRFLRLSSDAARAANFWWTIGLTIQCGGSVGRAPGVRVAD